MEVRKLRLVSFILIAIIWFIVGYKIGESDYENNARDADETIDMCNAKIMQLKGEIERYKMNKRYTDKLLDELTAENNGYRLAVERWQLQQDEKNKDYWG